MAGRFEDFTVGESHDSEALTVTEAHVVGFAGLTGDWIPLHVDAEYARESQFGERIAHGPLTLSLALGLVTRLPLIGDSVLAWLGLDEVRATAPVRLGDTIRVTAAVSSTRRTSSGDSGVVALRYQVRNQRDEHVMSFTNTLLVRASAEHVAAGVGS